MRMQTPMPVDQPVRFYKFVALSFLALTVVLLGVVIFMSSKRATITITTKYTPVDVTADVLVGHNGATNGVPGSATSTVLTFEESFTVSGTREEPGTATGEVTLHNETDRDQPLVKTTRLLTPEGILFRLSEGTTVPAQGTVAVEVYADEEGRAGNIGPTKKFTIPGLNEVKQQVIYASSDAQMTGGIRQVGALTQKDIDAAKKELAVRLEKQIAAAAGAEKAGMKQITSIGDIDATTDGDVGDEVDSFTLSGTADAVTVYYDEAALTAWGTAELEKRSIGDADSVTPGEGEPQVTFGAFDADTGIASLSVFFDGLVTLNPESRQIEKSMFFGKTRDEVRRYLLSLDHVNKVEVELKPVWMQTVPHIHDHVTVLVKEVE